MAGVGFGQGYKNVCRARNPETGEACRLDHRHRCDHRDASNATWPRAPKRAVGFGAMSAEQINELRATGQRRRKLRRDFFGGA